MKILEKTLSFRLEKGIIMIPGSVNGKKGHFAFDTGATRTALNLCQIDGGLNVEGNAIIFDQSTQSFGVQVLESAELVLDTLVMERGGLTLMDMSYVEKPMRKHFPDLVFLGAIGHDIIRDWRVLIDYPARRIVINPEKLPEEMRTITFVKNLLPIIKLDVSGREYCFILDTGANAFLFDKNAAPMSEIEFVEAEEGEAPQQIRRLSFAGQTYENVRGMVTDLSSIKSVIPEAEGIIGYDLLKDKVCCFDFLQNELHISK